MKKLLTFFLLGIMALSVVSCGDKEKASEQGNNATAVVEFDGSKYGLDLTSDQVQPMSEQRATKEVLAETAKDWLGGTTMFAFSSDKKTYAEFVEHIGCEPSEYQYNPSANQRTFIWRAEDDSTAVFSATFEEVDGKWELYATGSANLGIVFA